MTFRASGRRRAVALTLLALLAPASALAESQGEAAAAESQAEVADVEGAVPRDALPPSVGLDRLLRLPDSYTADSVTKAGATRTQWRQRFAEVRQEIEAARGELAATQAELETAAGDGGQWTASAPGLSGITDPNSTTVSYKLRQQLRQQREGVEVAEARMLDLQVRADLAEVPADWRE